MKKLILLILLIPKLIIASFFEENSLVVMIDPAGHAKNVGRKLVDGYERAETFKLAERLQEELQKKYNVRVILTRDQGEEIIDLQNASFANRLKVDLYLSISMYQEESVKPKVFMYNLIYNSLVDRAKHVIDPLSFIPLNQAHYANVQKTALISSDMKNVLNSPENQRRFDFCGPFGIPFKPLCGIIAPAVAIEIGICEENKWHCLVDPIVESLAFLKRV